jgi:hypothetical protein
LKAQATIKPYKGPRQTVNLDLPLPADLDEGTYEATVCDLTASLRRRIRNEPALMEPRDLDATLKAIRFQIEPQRTALYLHVPLQSRGLSVEGQPLPNLPGSARAVFSSNRQTQDAPVRTDLIQTASTPYVVEGSQTLRFSLVKDRAVSIK